MDIIYLTETEGRSPPENLLSVEADEETDAETDVTMYVSLNVI